MMKKRSLSLGGRPGPLSHAGLSQFSRRLSIPGCDIAPRPIESARADSQLADCGLQQESQSKHPFLSRSGHSYSSQSQRSLSQGCLTQSQNLSQRFSQNSQPEEYGCDQWKRPGFHDKETSLSQPKPPSPYFAGLTSSLNRRHVSGTTGGGSTPASSTCTSSAFCLVGPANSTPRPWPQCNVSEELEKRLGSLEKLREDETALLQNICDDYRQIKTFLEEACFESKDNRSKLSRQQNALHKLLKEEETANSSILAAIKTSEEAILQDIRNLKQAAEEADVAIKNIVTASFKRMIESFHQELANFKRDLKTELHVMKQPVPIGDMHHQLPNQPSHPRMDFTEFTPKHSLDQSSLPISIPDQVVDLDELPDSDLDTGLDFLARDDAFPACNLVAKISNRLDEHYNSTDEDIHRSVRRKMLPGRSITWPEGSGQKYTSLICLQDRSSLPVSIPDQVVDLNELPDSDLDTGLDFLARDDANPACNLVAKISNRLDEHYNSTDEDIHRSVRRKMLRAQRKVRSSIC